MLNRFLRQIRTVLLLVVLALLLAGVALPGAVGHLLRLQLTPALQSLATTPGTGGELQFVLMNQKAGWFYSQYEFDVRGQVLSVSGQQPASQHVQLSIAHGPIIWHLFNSLIGVAELQLINLSPVTGPDTPHASGSALLTLDRHLHLNLRAIVGFSALGGDHWLEARARWPALAQIWPIDWQRWPVVLSLYIDADARALSNSPAADALSVYQQQGWTRISGGRALTRLDLTRERLQINDVELPLSLFATPPALDVE